jgi:hypothetical protein
MVVRWFVRASIIFVIIFLLSFICGDAYGQSVIEATQVIEDLVITIDSRGMVHVEFNIRVFRGFNVINLPVRPIPETISVYYGDEYLPVMYRGELIIPSEYSGLVNVSYYADVSSLGSVFSFNIGFYNATLFVDDGVALLSLPSKIFMAETLDNRLKIVFGGPDSILYTIIEEETIVTSPYPFPDLSWFAAVLVPLSLGLVVLLIFRRRGRRG